MTGLRTRLPRVADRSAGGPQRGADAGVVVVVLLMIAAAVIPHAFDLSVGGDSFDPLFAHWGPHVGAGTGPAIVIGIVAVAFAPRFAATLRWGWLLASSFGAGIAWMVALATFDGWGGIGRTLEFGSEFLPTTRKIHDISAFLHEYVSRIPIDSPHHWPTQLAGHPPGAALFFIAIGHLGLDTGLRAGFVVVVLAATIPVTVMVTLHRLGAADRARRAAPLLVFGPAAIWFAVSPDAMFAAFAAAGLCAVAVAATTKSGPAGWAWSLLAGIVLGYCTELSYGLPLIGLIAIAILVAARTWRPLPGVIVGGVAIILGFAAAGFAWWQAFPVLHTRYYAGVASTRPASYWLWADLAAFAFSIGPVLGAAVVVCVRGVLGRIAGVRRTHPAVLLGTAALACVLIADLSLMSKSEVERIWLPFLPWLLMPLALLSDRWRRLALAGQITLALVLSGLLATTW